MSLARRPPALIIISLEAERENEIQKPLNGKDLSLGKEPYLSLIIYKDSARGAGTMHAGLRREQ